LLFTFALKSEKQGASGGTAQIFQGKNFAPLLLSFPLLFLPLAFAAGTKRAKKAKGKCKAAVHCHA
jgi:hypothetical protein